MYVLVLLEARGGGEGLPAVWAGVGPGTHVLGADVSLQVAGVREHLGTQTLACHILLVAPCGPWVRSWDGGLTGSSVPRPEPGRKGLCWSSDLQGGLRGTVRPPWTLVLP